MSKLRKNLYLLSAALALGGVSYLLVRPAPPQSITVLAGEEGGGYYYFARQYRRLLAREGIELRVKVTSGSLENLQRLRRAPGDAVLAFVQSGVGRGDEALGLVALGSLYYEPLWLFYRGEEDLTRLSQMRGRRVAVGARRSGTRAVALQLLADNGIVDSTAVLVALGGQEAARALERGTVDAAFFVASPQAAVVGELLGGEGIHLMSFARSEAYEHLHRYLSGVVLPRGVVDLRRDIPPRDVQLLAPAATLVVGRNFHPALVELLLQVASTVHGEGGIFEAPGQFPSPRHVDLPLAPEARRYFERGPSFLQRYLPFWAANLIGRFKYLVLPLITLLLPFSRLFPPLYRWRVRSKIYRWYRELSAVELRVYATGREDGLAARAAAELDRIEGEVVKISVPLYYVDEVYNLRLHIQLVRDKIGEWKQEGRIG